MAPPPTLVIILVAVLTTASASDRRPDVDEVPHFARWPVSQGKWGVIATNTPSSTPFAYPASYTDDGKGFPLFFFSRFDPVGREAVVDVRSSFAVSEISFTDCQGSDPQSPTCSKITLIGQLRELAEGSEEETRAKGALFDAHPAFKGFPSGNGSFDVYTLDIDEIYLVNKPAPARSLTVEEYLAV